MKQYRIITNGFDFAVQKHWKFLWWEGWSEITDGGYHPKLLQFRTRDEAQKYVDTRQLESAKREAAWYPL